MGEKKFRQVCYCEKCGSEAEMMITCELVPEESGPASGEKQVHLSDKKSPDSVPGHTVCTNCGAEADMWVDFGGK
ncbi:MAG: hypothetical protein ACLFPI_02075 [Desulfobacterales bacterium]